MLQNYCFSDLNLIHIKNVSQASRTKLCIALQSLRPMALYYFVRRFKKFQKIDKETICTFEYNFLNAALFKEF